MGIVVPIGSGKFNMDDIKDKFHTNCDGAKEAFEELCAMFDAVQAEREERREAAATRMAYVREQTTRLRERNRRLRARYAALVDAYNNWPRRRRSAVTLVPATKATTKEIT